MKILEVKTYKKVKKQRWVPTPTEGNLESGYMEEYEEIIPCNEQILREATEEELAELNKPIPREVEIEQIRTELASYDYIGVKLAMGVATREEYAEQIAHTEVLRARLRELEGNG